jgi:hypothetical protein
MHNLYLSNKANSFVYVMQECGGVRVLLHLILTSALEGECSASRLDRCNPQTRPAGTHWRRSFKTNNIKRSNSDSNLQDLVKQNTRMCEKTVGCVSRIRDFMLSYVHIYIYTCMCHVIVKNLDNSDVAKGLMLVHYFLTYVGITLAARITRVWLTVLTHAQK